MRHFFACGGNVSDFAHPGGIEQEAAVCAVRIHSGHRFVRIAGIGQVELIGHIGLVDSKDALEHQGMQHADIQAAQRGAGSGQQLLHDVLVPQDQQGRRAARIQGECLSAGLVFGVEPGGRFLQRDRFDRKVLLAGRQNFPLVKALQIAHHPMGGVYHQPGVLHIDQHHHHAVAGISLPGRPLRPALVAVIQRGFIAMMSIGNVELAVGKIAANGTDELRIADNPKPMGHTLTVGKFRRRGILTAAFELFSRRPVLVVIERINLAEIAPGGAHQIQTVGLGFGQGFFVGQHDPFAEFLQLDPADHAVDAKPLPPVGKFFLIKIQRRLFVAGQGAFLLPAVQYRSRFVVRMLSLTGQLQPDDVVIVAPKILHALYIADDVVGRTDQLIDFACCRRKAQGAEGCDFCHVIFLPMVQSYRTKKFAAGYGLLYLILELPSTIFQHSLGHLPMNCGIECGDSRHGLCRRGKTDKGEYNAEWISSGSL